MGTQITFVIPNLNKVPPYFCCSGYLYINVHSFISMMLAIIYVMYLNTSNNYSVHFQLCMYIVLLTTFVSFLQI